jgi:hypothetical protein
MIFFSFFLSYCLFFSDCTIKFEFKGEIKCWASKVCWIKFWVDNCIDGVTQKWGRVSLLLCKVQHWEGPQTAPPHPSLSSDSIGNTNPPLIPSPTLDQTRVIHSQSIPPLHHQNSFFDPTCFITQPRSIPPVHLNSSVTLTAWNKHSIHLFHFQTSTELVTNQQNVIILKILVK